jgi:hypothetical protein
MAYKQLITSSITKAFRLLKDLAVVAVFSKPESQSFDFTTGKPSATLVVDTEAKVVVGKVKRTEKTETLQVIVESKIVDNTYTKVLIEDVPWTIVRTIVSNQYTTLLELSRTL